MADNSSPDVTLSIIFCTVTSDVLFKSIIGVSVSLSVVNTHLIWNVLLALFASDAIEFGAANWIFLLGNISNSVLATSVSE